MNWRTEIFRLELGSAGIPIHLCNNGQRITDTDGSGPPKADFAVHQYSIVLRCGSNRRLGVYNH